MSVSVDLVPATGRGGGRERGERGLVCHAAPPPPPPPRPQLTVAADDEVRAAEVLPDDHVLRWGGRRGRREQWQLAATPSACPPAAAPGRGPPPLPSSARPPHLDGLARARHAHGEGQVRPLDARVAELACERLVRVDALQRLDVAGLRRAARRVHENGAAGDVVLKQQQQQQRERGGAGVQWGSLSAPRTVPLPSPPSRTRTRRMSS